jgi:HD-GYP domain-containing protein (c-di-GMP phosphodiesterase class II)
MDIKEIEPISIGALLHDIGVASLPKYLANKDVSKMSPEELTVFKTHPSSGLKLLEGKKVLASEEVKAIIGQHHENMDGSGYPAGLRKEQIKDCARIVQIANALDRLTCVRPGQNAPLTPAAAIDKMMAENSPSEKFDNDMLTKIKGLLCPPNEKLININEVRDNFSKPVTMPPNPDAVDVNDTTRKRRRQKLGS